MNQKTKFHFDMVMIEGWREKALSGETMAAIARAASAELGRPVGPRAVKNRLMTTFPDEIAAMFSALAQKAPDDEGGERRQGVNGHIKEPGHPDTWNVLMVHTPSLAHLVGVPYDEIIHAG
jgi:hypothetical protein